MGPSIATPFAGIVLNLYGTAQEQRFRWGAPHDILLAVTSTDFKKNTCFLTLGVPKQLPRSPLRWSRRPECIYARKHSSSRFELLVRLTALSVKDHFVITALCRQWRRTYWWFISSTLNIYVKFKMMKGIGMFQYSF